MLHMLKKSKMVGIGGYDLIFFLSDGSIPNLRQKKLATLSGTLSASIWFMDKKSS